MTLRPIPASGAFETPRLEVPWQGRRANFVESLHAALHGPRPSPDFDPAKSFFRLRIALHQPPGRGIVGSFVSHVILLAICIPLSRMAMPKPNVQLPEIEITWYGPITDVAPVATPKPKEAKPEPRPKPQPKRRILARAYNPKTTVIFNPPRPTNTRQVLIHLDAPPTAPQFLPSMPNIISWADAGPVRPEIAMNPAALRARRARETETALRSPELVNATPPAGPIDIAPGSVPNPPMPIAPSAVMAERAASPRASAIPAVANAAPAAKSLAFASLNAAPQPPLPSAPNAVRAERAKSAATGAAAPNLTINAGRLVSLSLSPGSAPPPPVNASAPISIGPHVARKVSSAAAPDLSADAGSGAPGMPSANAASGPAGLLILHDSSAPAPPAPPRPRTTASLPKIAPVSPLSPRAAAPRIRASASASRSRILPNDIAHQVLGPWRIHTLLMNMPDLTSSSGSWLLNFAEPLGKVMRENNQIIAPLPVHSVDPEYPPALIEQGVEGKVILVAVIGVDGTVNQIRVVQSLNPVLDHNAAVALSQWKFDPALLHNRPVPLKVLVTVPFHFTTPRR
jgi:TonB family protein